MTTEQLLMTNHHESLFVLKTKLVLCLYPSFVIHSLYFYFLGHFAWHSLGTTMNARQEKRRSWNKMACKSRIKTRLYIKWECKWRIKKSNSLLRCPLSNDLIVPLLLYLEFYHHRLHLRFSIIRSIFFSSISWWSFWEWSWFYPSSGKRDTTIHFHSFGCCLVLPFRVGFRHRMRDKSSQTSPPPPSLDWLLCSPVQWMVPFFLDWQEKSLSLFPINSLSRFCPSVVLSLLLFCRKFLLWSFEATAAAAVAAAVLFFH